MIIKIIVFIMMKMLKMYLDQGHVPVIGISAQDSQLSQESLPQNPVLHSQVFLAVAVAGKCNFVSLYYNLKQRKMVGFVLLVLLLVSEVLLSIHLSCESLKTNCSD